MTEPVAIELLKRQRSAFKGQLTSFKGQIADASSIDHCESLLRRIQLVYEKYDAVQSKLEIIDETSSSDRTGFEEDYGNIESKLRNQLHDLKKKEEVTLATSFHNTSFHDLSANNQISTGIRLPEIILPSFSGLEADWLAFRDVFIDLIHTKALEPTVKFLYLNSCIRRGSAFSLIENLPITAENYEGAWAALCERYNNEINIQRFHTRELYNLKSPLEQSASTLQQFVDHASKHYNALKSLKVNVQSWDLLLIHHLTYKLDNASRVYIIKNTKPTVVLGFSELIELLRNRIKLLDAFKANTSSSSSRFVKPSTRVSLNATSNAIPPANNMNCCYCSGSHTLPNCPIFSSEQLNPQMRFHYIKERRICGNCLVGQHFIRDCKVPSCSICSLKHHVLLHFPTTESSSFHNKVRPSVNKASEVDHLESANVVIHPQLDPNCAATVTLNSSPLKVEKSSGNLVLLGTALVNATTSCGNKVPCRALLDSGSTMNFITLNACNLLRLRKQPTTKTISGVGAAETSIKQKVVLTISSRISDFSATLKFYVLPKITNDLPSTPIRFSTEFLPVHIQLADPYFNVPNHIDLLLGAEIYHQLFKGVCIQPIKELPPFFDSEFGFVICGKSTINICEKGLKQSHLTLCSLQSLDTRMRKFWELESLPLKPLFSSEETQAEEHYKANVKRSMDGRYSVALPIKPNLATLGNSYFSSHRQFLSLEKRLLEKPEIHQQYVDFMSEYRTLGHMTPALNANKNLNYYLPHHYVLRDQSLTTKLRVVFNASSKTSSGISLNDCLMVGPTIQQDLFSIMLRFRKHIVAFCGDIAKMYRQIRIHNDQVDLQRILWRDSNSKTVESFNLRTVTYGTACAPFLATRTLCQLSRDEQASFPIAAQVLINDFYVDDLLTGAPTLDLAFELKRDLIELLRRGGFELRKFISNISQLSEDNLERSTVTLVLGILWNTQSDSLEIYLNKLPKLSICTKRNILSEICSLFDPLGFCAPLTLIAKLLMRDIWLLKTIGWDDALPANIVHTWVTFKEELNNLLKISIPRLIGPQSSNLFELHGFCDASERAFGCVLYSRTVSSSQEYQVNFLCAKSRVAPLKKETIPRLELCAAVLLAEVVNKVVSIMGVNFTKVFLWTDSMVTLFRIKSEAYKYATFVANRITKIQELTSSNDWYHVRTDANPADMVSRGLKPSQFSNASLWWEGPNYLKTSSNSWPKTPSECFPEESVLLEQRKISKTVLSQTVSNEVSIFHRYHSVSKLFRVVAYILRFAAHTRSKITRSSCNTILLHPQEIKNATVQLITIVQLEYFKDEIASLITSKKLPRKSSLHPLSVYLDDQGLLRVGGRLTHADISEDHKHPILLPSRHVISTLIARHEHIRLLHAGPQTLLYNIRLTYWIIGGRNLCKRIVHECVRCFRAQPQIRHQIMGDLPSDRVNKCDRPFSIVGIDFCGPFYIIQNTRSKIKHKTYICLFVCFTTKAAHLEVVMNLTTEAVIACLRRFVARRGLCSKIYSDNATNFVGARSELKELKRLFLSQTFQKTASEFCTTQNIEWVTIPPRSPHFGGLWEAAVKSTKFHFKRVVGTSTLTLEEFSTLTCQIEACLNSRPLTALSCDPVDFNALTPGHFLIGAPLCSIPEPSLLDLNTNRLSRFQAVQQMMHRFWDRWHVEYLSELQRRNKWNKSPLLFKIGSLVLIHDDNSPPIQWILGRITKLHYGADGQVRVVSLRTARNEFTRAVNKISLLPLPSDDQN